MMGIFTIDFAGASFVRLHYIEFDTSNKLLVQHTHIFNKITVDYKVHQMKWRKWEKFKRGLWERFDKRKENTVLITSC